MSTTRRIASRLLVAAALVVAARAQSPSELALRYARFDPMRGEPAIAAALRLDEGAGLWIVQFDGKPTEELRAAIAATGGEVKGFLPHTAHLVRMDAQAAARVRGIAGIRWVGSYHPAYRIDPALQTTKGVDLEAPVRRFHLVVVDKHKDKAALVRALEALRVRVTHEHPGSILLEAEMSGAQLLEAARLDQVLWIDEVTPIGHDMANARLQTGAAHVELLGGYTGRGIRGHIHEGIQQDHPDFTEMPTPIFSCPTADDHGHCTAGIVFGNGTSSPTARGMAPDLKAYYTNEACLNVGVSRWQVVDSLVNTHEVMFTTASWGNGLTANYTSITADADDIVFDHGIAWTQSQSNTGTQQSRPQAWAKNVFSIGAVRHFDNADPADDVWGGGGSIGPASDGRIKPDLCSYYDAIETSDRTGAAGYDGGDSFLNFGGTSGATPIVAGANALAIQMFTDGLFGALRVPGGTRFQNRPNFTTLKALQIAAASPYAFTAASTENRREQQGWGQPNLRSMYDDRNAMFVVDETRPLQQDQAVRYRVQVPRNRSELKVAMTFADPAANPSAALARVNDLTLRVTAPNGNVYWGNAGLRTGNASQTGGAPDAVDTVECVFVPNPQDGVWTVDVIADLVVADTHLATPAVDADFGLAVRGAVSVGEGLPGTATAFGQGCPGSTPADPVACFVTNDTPAKSSVALRPNCLYALELVAPTALNVVGFEIFANSTTGLPQQLAAHVRRLDGSGIPTVVASTGNVTLQAGTQWVTAAIAPVTIAQGQTFYVGFDTLAVAPSVWESTTGGIDVPYFRLENGVWSARTTGRFEWSIKVLCQSTTTRTPLLVSSGIYDVGQSYSLNIVDALPIGFAGISIASSRTNFDGIPLPFSLAPVGAPLCTVLTNADQVLGNLTNAQGAFGFTLNVPLDAGLIGGHVFHQGVVLDPTANGFGFVTTRALDVRFGD